VKNLDETLKYNLTFFVTTGTIRAQGSQYGNVVWNVIMRAPSSYKFRSMASYGHLRAFPVRLFNFDGKHSRGDIPETWSDRHDAANCILIEVKNLDETLKYNLTFFVTTGTIRAQGIQ
jgi:hypothetical protein